jgi:hypothetical protein
MGANTRTWWILFLVSIILIIITGVLHTVTSFSMAELARGRLITQTSPVAIVVFILGFVNWILLPLSIIMLYTSLGKEKRWYEIVSLFGFILTIGVFYLITPVLSMLNLGNITQALLSTFLTKFLYLTFVPLLVILFFSLFESVRIIKKLE